ncbi:MAG: potassium channel family protein [Micromonosporaceae bacterium]
MAGAAVTNVRLTTPERVAQVILTFDGMAFLPTLTAAIVGARLARTLDWSRTPIKDHVIMVGLGNVGTRIVGQLHDLGVSVVCIDRDPHAQGMSMARRLGVPVVTGQASRDETLRAAGIDTCQTLVSVTSRDVVNLETALHARSLREDVRIVVRLFDDDLAERVEKNLEGDIVSRSVSYLAAPSFAIADARASGARGPFPWAATCCSSRMCRSRPAHSSKVFLLSTCTRRARRVLSPCAAAARMKWIGSRTRAIYSLRRTG